MNREQFRKLRQIIADQISHSEIDWDTLHSINTCQWFLKIFPKASYELQIAALAHDIERGVKPRERKQDNETYDDYKRRHSKRSAEIMKKILEKNSIETNSINKIVDLILKHEVGGYKEANILQDADSISFFDIAILSYLKRKGEEKTRAKIKWMYSRCSKLAKSHIRKLPNFKKFQSLFKSS